MISARFGEINDAIVKQLVLGIFGNLVDNLTEMDGGLEIEPEPAA